MECGRESKALSFENFEPKINKKKTKTNNTRDSPVVTDLSTSLALLSLIRGERTGSHVF